MTQDKTVTFETFDQNDEERRPDQRKDDDKDKYLWLNLKYTYAETAMLSKSQKSDVGRRQSVDLSKM